MGPCSRPLRGLGRDDSYGAILLRIPACSTEGSGADVTGCVGAAAGFSCCALCPRRIEARVAAVASDAGAIEACMVSRPPPRRTNSQYAKPKPEIAPRKLLSLVLVSSKHGLKNAPLTCEQIRSSFGKSVPGGRCMKRVLPLPPIRTTPATEPSLKMRPVPLEPSKQLNENSLPATKRRAASAFIGSARTGAAANRLPNTTAARKAMKLLPVNHPGRGILPDDCRQILNAFTRS